MTICDDPDDDKFLSCALVCKTQVIVNGDKHLLKVSGWRSIRALKPGSLSTNICPSLLNPRIDLAVSSTLAPVSFLIMYFGFTSLTEQSKFRRIGLLRHSYRAYDEPPSL